MRYLAGAGPSAALARLKRGVLTGTGGDSLKLILDLPKLVLFAAPSMPFRFLPGGGGLLLGWLLGRGGEPIDLTGGLEQRVRATGGAELLEVGWGSYLLFLVEEEGHLVLRDPSGTLPLFFRCGEGIQIYGSDPDVMEALAAPAGVDPGFIAHWLTFPYLKAAETGISGTRELLPGCRRRVSRSGASVDLLWDPWRHAAPERHVETFEAAVAALLKVAVETVPAQALGRPLLLQLSGGLDSSIVAASLAQAGVPFEALTYATLSSDGDERAHARAMAASAGAPLTEYMETDGPIDLSAPAELSFRPGPNPVLRPLQEMLAASASKRGAWALLDGAGGDNLFCYLTTAAPVLDAARLGSPLTAISALRDVAELGGCTLWRAGTIALRKALRLPRRDYWKRDLTFLIEEAAPREPNRHPWLDSPPGIPIGTLEHVEALVHIHHFLERRSNSSLLALHPLLSQPLMELCLKIPTWFWVRGGRDRAVARAAFQELLPPSIVNRRVKGSLESLFLRSYLTSRQALQGLLLDGELRRRGIIDSEAVEAYLRAPGEPKDNLYVRLTEMAALELWIRSWTGRPALPLSQ